MSSDIWKLSRNLPTHFNNVCVTDVNDKKPKSERRLREKSGGVWLRNNIEDGKRRSE